jgi:hypothetical protein
MTNTKNKQATPQQLLRAVRREALGVHPSQGTPGRSLRCGASLCVVPINGVSIDTTRSRTLPQSCGTSRPGIFRASRIAAAKGLSSAATCPSRVAWATSRLPAHDLAQAARRSLGAVISLHAVRERIVTAGMKHHQSELSGA